MKDNHVQEESRMGNEKVSSLLFSLAIPAIIGQIVSLLYNVVDRIYIGHIPDIGGDALTGVGVTMPIIIIISAFSALIGMGGAPQATIKMGKGDKEGASKILGNCFTMLIIISVILTGFFLIFNEKLLLLFGASQVTLPYAMEYMNIYTIGTIFVQLSIGLNPFISTQGFSKTSMMTIMIGAVINIVLDPILMFGFGMGVSGAALATILSQALSAIWVVYFLNGKRTQLKIQKKYMRLNKAVMLPVLALGLSPFVMQATESLINIIFNSSLQKYGGDSAVGAMTILVSAMQFMFLPLMGLTQGAQPIISYNYGAGNKDRVKEAYKLLLVVAMSYTTIFWLFLMFAPQIFVGMFTSNPAIVETGTWALRLYISAGFLLGAQVACQQTFIALGNAKTSLFLALLRKVFLLIPLIYILPTMMENKVFAVFLSEPIADVIAVTITVVLFYIQFKKTLDEMEQETYAK